MTSTTVPTKQQKQRQRSQTIWKLKDPPDGHIKNESTHPSYNTERDSSMEKNCETKKKWDIIKSWVHFLQIADCKHHDDTKLRSLSGNLQRIIEWLIENTNGLELSPEELEKCLTKLNFVSRKSVTNDTTTSKLLRRENLQQNVSAYAIMVIENSQLMEERNFAETNVVSPKQDVYSADTQGLTMQMVICIANGDFSSLMKLPAGQATLFLVNILEKLLEKFHLTSYESLQKLDIGDGEGWQKILEVLAAFFGAGGSGDNLSNSNQSGGNGGDEGPKPLIKCRKPKKHKLKNKEACGTTPQMFTASDAAGGSENDLSNSSQSGGEAQQQNSSTSNTTESGTSSSHPSQSRSAGEDGGDEGRKPPNNDHTSLEKAPQDGDGKDDNEGEGESGDQEKLANGGAGDSGDDSSDSNQFGGKAQQYKTPASSVTENRTSSSHPSQPRSAGGDDGDGGDEGQKTPNSNHTLLEKAPPDGGGKDDKEEEGESGDQKPHYENGDDQEKVKHNDSGDEDEKADRPPQDSQMIPRFGKDDLGDRSTCRQEVGKPKDAGDETVRQRPPCNHKTPVPADQQTALESQKTGPSFGETKPGEMVASTPTPQKPSELGDRQKLANGEAGDSGNDSSDSNQSGGKAQQYKTSASSAAENRTSFSHPSQSPSAGGDGENEVQKPPNNDCTLLEKAPPDGGGIYDTEEERESGDKESGYGNGDDQENVEHDDRGGENNEVGTLTQVSQGEEGLQDTALVHCQDNDSLDIGPTPNDDNGPQNGDTETDGDKFGTSSKQEEALDNCPNSIDHGMEKPQNDYRFEHDQHAIEDGAAETQSVTDQKETTSASQYENTKDTRHLAHEWNAEVDDTVDNKKNASSASCTVTTDDKFFVDSQTNQENTVVLDVVLEPGGNDDNLSRSKQSGENAQQYKTSTESGTSSDNHPQVCSAGEDGGDEERKPPKKPDTLPGEAVPNGDEEDDKENKEKDDGPQDADDETERREPPCNQKVPIRSDQQAALENQKSGMSFGKTQPGELVASTAASQKLSEPGDAQASTQAPQHLAVDQARHNRRKPEKHDLENKEACCTTPQGLASEGAGGSGNDSRNSHQSGGEAQQQNSSTSNTTGNGNQSSNPSQSPSADGDGGDEGRKPPNNNRTSPEKALQDDDGEDDNEEDGESDDQEPHYENGEDQEKAKHGGSGGENKKVDAPTQESQVEEGLQETVLVHCQDNDSLDTPNGDNGPQNGDTETDGGKFGTSSKQEKALDNCPNSIDHGMEKPQNDYRFEHDQQQSGEKTQQHKTSIESGTSSNDHPQGCSAGGDGGDEGGKPPNNNPNFLGNAAQIDDETDDDTEKEKDDEESKEKDDDQQFEEDSGDLITRKNAGNQEKLASSQKYQRSEAWHFNWVIFKYRKYDLGDNSTNKQDVRKPTDAGDETVRQKPPCNHKTPVPADQQTAQKSQKTGVSFGDTKLGGTAVSISVCGKPPGFDDAQTSTPTPLYRTVGQARRRRRKPKKHKLENKGACGTTLQNRRDQVKCQEKTGISKQRKKGGFYRNNKSRDKRRKCQGEKSAARNEENCLRAKDSQQAVRRDQAYTRPVCPLRVKGVPLWKKKKVKGLRSNHEFKSWRQRAQSRCQGFPKNSLPVRMENRAADATPLKNQSTDGKSQTRKEELFGQAQERLNIGVDRLGNQHAACQTVDPDGYLDNQGNLATRSSQSLEQIAVLQKNPCDKVKVHQHVQLADGLGPTKELPAIKLPINLDSDINAAKKDGRPTAKERLVDEGQSAVGDNAAFSDPGEKAVQNNDLDFAHQKNDDEVPGCVQVPRQAKSIQLIKPLPAEEDFNTQKTAQQNESFPENSWLKNRHKAWKGNHYRSKQQNLHSLLKPPEKATEPIDLGGNQVAIFCVVNPNNGNPSPQTLPTEAPGGGGAGSVPRQSTTHDETGFGESQQTYDYHDNHIRDLHQVGEPPDIQLPPADAPQQPELPWPPPAIAGDDNENQLIVPRQVFDFEDENINFLQGVGEEVGVQEEDNVAELELHEMVQTDDFDDTDELYAP